MSVELTRDEPRGRRCSGAASRSCASTDARAARRSPSRGYTTMRVGGPAERMVLAETTDELVDAVREVDDADEPLLVLGGGSNLVLPDEGFAGTVVQGRDLGVEVRVRGLLRRRERHGGRRGAVGPLRRAGRRRGLGRASRRSSGIPGSTGATPIQNVGAYGQEVSQTVARVRVWDRLEERVRTMTSPTAASPTGTRCSRAPTATSCSTSCSSSTSRTLSRPVAYADLAPSARGRGGGAGAARDAREAVLAQRRRRGMVLDEPRPRHLVLRLVLHQPRPPGG